MEADPPLLYGSAAPCGSTACTAPQVINAVAKPSPSAIRPSARLPGSALDAHGTPQPAATALQARSSATGRVTQYMSWPQRLFDKDLRRGAVAGGESSLALRSCQSKAATRAGGDLCPGVTGHVGEVGDSTEYASPAQELVLLVVDVHGASAVQRKHDPFTVPGGEHVRATGLPLHDPQAAVGPVARPGVRPVVRPVVRLVVRHKALTAVLQRCRRHRPRPRPPGRAASVRPPGPARWAVGVPRATSRMPRPGRRRPHRRAEPPAAWRSA